MTPLEAAQKRIIGWTGDANDVNLAGEAVRVFLTTALRDAETLMRAGNAINRLFPPNGIVVPPQTDRLATAVIASLLKSVAGEETLESIGGEPPAGSGFENERPTA